MRLKVLLVLVAVCVALMATASFAADTCYVATDTCYVCRTLVATPLHPVGYITVLDLGVCDTVRIGCPFRIATVVSGDSIMVPIYVWNDEELGGFSLGFVFDSTALEIVKKTYDTTGSAISSDVRPYILEKIEAGQYLIGWADFSAENPLSVHTTATLLITINFKVKSTATPSTIVIDSAFVPPAGRFVLSNTLGVPLKPQFVHCRQGDIILGDTPCGDVDGSGNINIADVVYMVNYIFKHGPPPQDASGGDVDCDLSVTIADVVYFINYIFRGGPQPCFECW
ncbi:MAG: cohesin domain-containing protein [candidate division Zixibacteria bacterium]|nr:cohesin domain-containing protein [candidate division Zixibacteria bacterium]